MFDMFKAIIDFIHHPISQLAIYNLLILLGCYSASWGLKKLQEFLLSKYHHSWQRLLMEAIYLPAKIFAWVFALLLCLEISLATSKDSLPVKYIDQLRLIAFVVIFSWALFRAVHLFEQTIQKKIEKKKKFDLTSFKALTNISKVIIFTLITLMILPTLGIPLSGVIAFGGIGGLAISFAAKDLLANFFGGIMIFFDRPFSIGDWIRSPDREIEGFVEQIGLRHIRIRTFDQRPLYIPNSVFLSIAIENVSRMANRRIKSNIGIRYQDADKLASIVQDVENMLFHHKDIEKSKMICVKFVEIKEFSLEFMVYVFTKTVDFAEYHAVREDVFFKILKIIEKHGAKLAYPTSDINLTHLDQSKFVTSQEILNN